MISRRDLRFQMLMEVYSESFGKWYSLQEHKKMNGARGKQQPPCADQFSHTTGSWVRRPHLQEKSPEAKGGEAGSLAGPRLEGVTIAEAQCHSQSSLLTCQELE